MKPASLRPGTRIRVLPTSPGGETLAAVFVRRVPRSGGRPAYSLVRFSVYAGLPSADADGTIQMSDYDLSRRGVVA